MKNVYVANFAFRWEFSLLESVDVGFADMFVGLRELLAPEPLEIFQCVMILQRRHGEAKVVGVGIDKTMSALSSEVLHV